ncbi:hypothetical protein ACTVJH_11360 [Desulfoplanes sp. PS50]
MSRDIHAQIEDGVSAAAPVARLRDVSLRYGKVRALDEALTVAMDVMLNTTITLMHSNLECIKKQVLLVRKKC